MNWKKTLPIVFGVAAFVVFQIFAKDLFDRSGGVNLWRSAVAGLVVVLGAGLGFAAAHLLTKSEKGDSESS